MSYESSWRFSSGRVIRTEDYRIAVPDEFEERQTHEHDFLLISGNPDTDNEKGMTLLLCGDSILRNDGLLTSLPAEENRLLKEFSAETVSDRLNRMSEKMGKKETLQFGVFTNTKGRSFLTETLILNGCIILTYTGWTEEKLFILKTVCSFSKDSRKAPEETESAARSWIDTFCQPMAEEQMISSDSSELSEVPAPDDETSSELRGKNAHKDRVRKWIVGVSAACFCLLAAGMIAVLKFNGAGRSSEQKNTQVVVSDAVNNHESLEISDNRTDRDMLLAQAISLGNSGDYEDALDHWEELEETGELSEQEISKKEDCIFEYASALLDEGNYIDCLYELSLLPEDDARLESDMVLEAKYQYVQHNLHCRNTHTYGYLYELTKQNYKDAKSISEELYAQRIEVDYVNNDEYSKEDMESISKQDTIWIHYSVYGSYEQWNYFDIEVTYPNGCTVITDKQYSIKSGWGGVWYIKFGKFCSPQAGTMTIRFYDIYGNVLGERSVTITD